MARFRESQRLRRIIAASTYRWNKADPGPGTQPQFGRTSLVPGIGKLPGQSQTRLVYLERPEARWQPPQQLVERFWRQRLGMVLKDKKIHLLLFLGQPAQHQLSKPANVER